MSLLLSAVAYLGFVVVTLWTVVFLAGVVVPRGVDGPARTSTPVAVSVDLALLLLFALAGCDARRDAGAVVASVIGGRPELKEPARGSLTEADRLLLDSTAQGLVRFDASGQIEPGVAERWTVIDGGMSYIFRIRDATWSDGKPVTAAEVVASDETSVRVMKKTQWEWCS